MIFTITMLHHILLLCHLFPRYTHNFDKFLDIKSPFSWRGEEGRMMHRLMISSPIDPRPSKRYEMGLLEVREAWHLECVWFTLIQETEGALPALREDARRAVVAGKEDFSDSVWNQPEEGKSVERGRWNLSPECFLKTVPGEEIALWLCAWKFMTWELSLLCS